VEYVELLAQDQQREVFGPRRTTLEQEQAKDLSETDGSETEGHRVIVAGATKGTHGRKKCLEESRPSGGKLQAFGGAEGAAQSDLGTSFEDGDDHDIGDTNCTDEEGYGAETEEEVVEGSLCVGPGHEGLEWLADVDLARSIWVCRGCMERLDGVVAVGLGAHVDGGGTSEPRSVSAAE